MEANCQTVGLPQWDDKDQTLARGIQHELKAREQGLASKLAPLKGPIPEEQQRGGGSDDIGDISWNVPTVIAPFPLEHPRAAGPQLGERDLDGDADRAQGRDRRRKSAGAHDARHPDAP